MNILVIAAHPDDEVLGMGGTIKKLTKTGNHVKIVIMATGIAARRSTNFQNNPDYKINKKNSEVIEKQIAEIRRQSKKSSKILGVNDIEFLDFPDNEMDKISRLEIVKKIEFLIDDFKPDVVYTHSQNDINIDHRLVYESTIIATRPSEKNIVKEVYSFEVPSSSEWNFTHMFTPNTFVKIDQELKFKIKAMSKYVTEIEKYPHPRSLEALEIIAKRWGTVSGYNAAEAFVLIRRLRINLDS
jgi:LmbE family N-acetylglucosaminyl deacetylase